MGRSANLAALGYAAFAITLWLVSMGAAGWLGPPAAGIASLAAQPPTGDLLPMLAATLGGGVMAVVGMTQWWRGRALDATLFLAFAAFWWVAALSSRAMGSQVPTIKPSGLLGWYYIAWSLLAFCIWLGWWRRDIARMLFALGLCASLFAFALADWLGLDALTVLGGYLGLVTAILGIYVAAALVVNQAHGRILLPLGDAGMHDGRDQRDGE